MHVSHSSQKKCCVLVKVEIRWKVRLYEDGEFVTEFDRRRFVSCFQNLRSSELSLSGLSHTNQIEFWCGKENESDQRKKEKKQREEERERHVEGYRKRWSAWSQ